MLMSEKTDLEEIAMEEKYIIYTEKDVQRFLKEGHSLRNVPFRYGQFRGIDLSKKDLTDADFRDADLREANLEQAILINADFRGADLSGANLVRTNLQNAKFDNAQLNRTKFDRAIMVNASLKNTALYGAYLRLVTADNADFSGANLQRAHLDGMMGTKSVKFDRADMRDAHVRYVGFDMTALKKVGAQTGSKYPERGWTPNVFSFTKTSWTEFMPHISFSWLFRGIGMLFHFVFWPVRFVIKQMASVSKGTRT
ncbi:pentapeptide repeat protein [Candidatus Moduliflexus flocculans]|uniref:Pentapeptide repeat protein n=1 Tax=Candidatus Moduliflexus flocculans TaxID=1499966 RepID=A0A0S6VQE6_9BACT|nr:pentapeptide repeat protein [Candidatus Moduliflexus flocculans]